MSGVIFTDGFDYYTNPASKWDVIITSAGLSPAIVAGSGRGGAGALYCTGNSGIGGYGYCAVEKHPGAYTSMYVGFAFNLSAYSTTDTFLLQFQDSAGSKSQVDLWINGAGNFTVKTGTANGQTPSLILGPSTYVYPAGSYHFIEMYVSIGVGSGAVTVKVDQAVVLSGTGLTTQTSTNAYLNIIRLGTGSQGGVAHYGYVDDVYFSTSGFNGDNRINGLLPNGNGSASGFSTSFSSWAGSTVEAVGNTIVDSNGNVQRVASINNDFKTGTGTPTWATIIGANTTDNHVVWTCLGPSSQYLAVNESSIDGDVSYIYSNTVGATSRFTMPPITGSAISSVILWLDGRKDDGGYRAVQASYKTGSTVATSGTDTPLGGNYQQIGIPLPTDATGLPWTVASVNATEYGVKLTG